MSAFSRCRVGLYAGTQELFATCMHEMALKVCSETWATACVAAAASCTHCRVPTDAGQPRAVADLRCYMSADKRDASRPDEMAF